ADEPVAAYREPLRQRLARWRRRHPALVTGTAALLLTALVGLGVGGWLVSREQRAKVAEQDRRVLAQVDALLDASPQAVPNLLSTLADYRHQVRSRLRQKRAEPEPREQTAARKRLWQQHRTRAALALLAEDAEQLPFLRERLLAEEVEPEEMLLIRDRLVPHKEKLAEDLWAEVGRRDPKDPARFRALVALAGLDPTSPRWREAGKEVVGPLLA